MDGMNTRIAQLLAQAHLEVEDVKDTNKIAEIFAELIVRECARVDSEENNPDHVDGETYNQTILQHFGVEK